MVTGVWTPSLVSLKKFLVTLENTLREPNKAQCMIALILSIPGSTAYVMASGDGVYVTRNRLKQEMLKETHCTAEYEPVDFAFPGGLMVSKEFRTRDHTEVFSKRPIMWRCLCDEHASLTCVLLMVNAWDPEKNTLFL